MSSRLKWFFFYLIICSFPLFYSSLSENHKFHPADGLLFSLKFAPYLGLGLVALLGWQINQTRIFWATLFFLLTYHFLLHPDAIWLSQTNRFVALQILSVGFPLGLGIIY